MSLRDYSTRREIGQLSRDTAETAREIESELQERDEISISMETVTESRTDSRCEDDAEVESDSTSEIKYHAIKSIRSLPYEEY